MGPTGMCPSPKGGVELEAGGRVREALTLPRLEIPRNRPRDKVSRTDSGKGSTGSGWGHEARKGRQQSGGCPPHSHGGRQLEHNPTAEAWGAGVGPTLPSAHPRGHKGGRLLPGALPPATRATRPGEKVRAQQRAVEGSPHQRPGQERGWDTETPPWHPGTGQPGSHSWVSDQGHREGTRRTRTEMG